MIKRKVKVLLLSAPIGSGHRMAAEAIKEELQEYQNIEVIHGNVFSFFPKVLGDIFIAVYLWILKVCPWLYQMTYAWGNKETGSLWLKNLINKALLCLGSKYLNDIQPDVIIATHATPAGIMSFYKEKHNEVFLGVVVTDFTVHKWWICKNADAYFVADERLASEFPEGSIVKPYGIPIRKTFTVDDSRILRSELGWDEDENVCLVMGGGEGLLPMNEIVSSLKNIMQGNLRVVCLCGNNVKLQKQLADKFMKDEKVEIIGFTDKVPEYMKAADMIISKAGGLTASEVLACDLELLIYKPLPGQELNNAAFLKKFYAAHVIENITDLVLCVEEICKKPKIKDCNEYHGKYATRNICEYINSIITNNT